MKSGQSLPDIYQTYPKSGHTFGGHTPTPRLGSHPCCPPLGLLDRMNAYFSISSPTLVGFFVYGRMGGFGYGTLVLPY